LGSIRSQMDEQRMMQLPAFLVNLPGFRTCVLRVYIPVGLDKIPFFLGKNPILDPLDSLNSRKCSSTSGSWVKIYGPQQMEY